MQHTLYINKEAVCTYEIEGDIIYIKTWSPYWNENAIIQAVSLIVEKEFKAAAYLNIEKP